MRLFNKFTAGDILYSILKGNEHLFATKYK